MPRRIGSRGERRAHSTATSSARTTTGVRAMSSATRPSSNSHGVVPASASERAVTSAEPVRRHASRPSRSSAASTAAVATPRATPSSGPVTRKTAASAYGIHRRLPVRERGEEERCAGAVLVLQRARERGRVHREGGLVADEAGRAVRREREVEHGDRDDDGRERGRDPRLHTPRHRRDPNRPPQPPARGLGPELHVAVRRGDPGPLRAGLERLRRALEQARDPAQPLTLRA